MGSEKNLCSLRLFPIFKKYTSPTSTFKTEKVEHVRQKKSSSFHISPKWLQNDYNKGEQLMLDCGQKLIGVVQCHECGMAYSHGDPADTATHNKYHTRLSADLKFPGWKSERVKQIFDNGDRIILTLPGDRHASKKVEAIRQLVDKELGFVEKTCSNQTWQMYLYIANRMIVGCCIAEIISEAYPLTADISNEDKSSSTSKLWFRSTESRPAQCGVSRIWVLKSYRRKGIASKLLDCVRCSFFMGCVLNRDQLAFSDPTPLGAQFAASFTNCNNFLVYSEVKSQIIVV